MFKNDFRHVHLVGIKGTGMCAMAEFLHHEGVYVSGSDTKEVFYTDKILSRIGINPTEFSEINITDEIDMIIYSAAYDPSLHVELIKAKQLGIKMLSYPQALGEISKTRLSLAICGVHGKTTTTGLAGIIAEAMSLPAAIIAGGAISAFNDSSIQYLGDKILIAETCEYRRHFLNYHPSYILLTSVESDHQDYYPDYSSIRDAFVEFCLTLPNKGKLVFCADDPGAVDVANRVSALRNDIEVASYGFTENSSIRINNYISKDGVQKFSVSLYPLTEFSIPIPGMHTVLDAVGALFLTSLLYNQINNANPSEYVLEKCKYALERFRGAKRRSELIGEYNDILIYDDYGHHPTAIEKTIKGFKDFFPNRRIVIDFMSHTNSRTKALFHEFSNAFSNADIIIAHKIYTSAREGNDPEISGELLAEAIKKTGKQVFYYAEPLDALDDLLDLLKPGDLFITMGAGNNWQIGVELIKRWKGT